MTDDAAEQHHRQDWSQEQLLAEGGHVAAKQVDTPPDLDEALVNEASKGTGGVRRALAARGGKLGRALEIARGQDEQPMTAVRGRVVDPITRLRSASSNGFPDIHEARRIFGGRPRRGRRSSLSRGYR
jgi:hypothetical protein